MELINVSKKIYYTAILVGNLVGCGGVDKADTDTGEIDESKTYIKSNVEISDSKNNTFNVLSVTQQENIIDDDSRIYKSQSNFPDGFHSIQLNFKQGDNRFSINIEYNLLTHKYNQITYINNSEKFYNYSGCVEENYRFGNFFDKCENLDFNYNEETGELNLNFKNTLFKNKILQGMLDSTVNLNGSLNAKVNYKIKKIDDFPKQSNVKLSIDGKLLNDNNIHFDDSSIFFYTDKLNLYMGWFGNINDSINFSTINSNGLDDCSFKSYKLNDLGLVDRKENSNITLNFKNALYGEENSFNNSCVNSNEIKKIEGFISYPKFNSIRIPIVYSDGDFLVSPYFSSMSLVNNDIILFESGKFNFKIKDEKVVYVSYKNNEYNENKEIISYEYKCENEKCSNFIYDQSKNIVYMNDAELYLSVSIAGIKDRIKISGEMVYVR